MFFCDELVSQAPNKYIKRISLIVVLQFHRRSADTAATAAKQAGTYGRDKGKFLKSEKRTTRWAPYQ